jgi:hypothetical protein
MINHLKHFWVWFWNLPRWNFRVFRIFCERTQLHSTSSMNTHPVHIFRRLSLFCVFCESAQFHSKKFHQCIVFHVVYSSNTYRFIRSIRKIAKIHKSYYSKWNLFHQFLLKGHYLKIWGGFKLMDRKQGSREKTLVARTWHKKLFFLTLRATWVSNSNISAKLTLTWKQIRGPGGFFYDKKLSLKISCKYTFCIGRGGNRTWARIRGCNVAPLNRDD